MDQRARITSRADGRSSDAGQRWPRNPPRFGRALLNLVSQTGVVGSGAVGHGALEAMVGSVRMSGLSRDISGAREQMPDAVVARALRRAVVTKAGRVDCGVKVLSGDVPGERNRWRHRPRKIEGDALVIGDNRIRLRLIEQIPHPGASG